MSSATVNRPTSCSRCAIRSILALDCLSAGSKRGAAFSRSGFRFHFESCSPLRLCRRHSSACELSPRKCLKNNFSLKCGSESSSFSFRHRILLFSRWILYHNLVLESGPNFRWQYKQFVLHKGNLGYNKKCQWMCPLLLFFNIGISISIIISLIRTIFSIDM